MPPTSTERENEFLSYAIIGTRNRLRHNLFAFCKKKCKTLQISFVDIKVFRNFVMNWIIFQFIVLKTRGVMPFILYWRSVGNLLKNARSWLNCLHA